MGIEEMAARLLKLGGAPVTPSSVILACVTLRSMVAHLMERGLTAPVADERGVRWKLSR